MRNFPKFKVAIVEPVGGHGGMDYYDFGLCSSLVKGGVDAILYTCDATNNKLNNKFRIVRSYQGIYGSDPAWRRGLRFLYGSLRTILDAVLKKAIIGHFHFFYAGPLEFFNILLARIMLRRVVVTVHDVESFVGSFSTPVIARWSYKLAHHVIVHNRVSKEEIVQKMALPDRKISIIPHGNYLHMLRSLPSQKESRERLGIPENGKVLLFFGQIKEVKGLDLLLRALPAVLEKDPHTYLLIGGKPWKTDFSQYEKIMDDLGIRENCVVHIGYVPNEEVPFYYSAVDLVVLPYRRIYQSGVILMAMSYGKPVLASDLPGMAEVVTDGETGFLFKMGDPVHLSKQILHILADKEKLQMLAQAGLRLMKSGYGWENIGRLTKECYLKVIDNH